ncbi:hypothetical protein RUM44_002549 [Polyplax serrata]|uniref:Uncharacterized protein n=1 Tax=Polyplax serrata TaxID=468196 RepID=A0ABR1AFK5_POLSC
MDEPNGRPDVVGCPTNTAKIAVARRLFQHRGWVSNDPDIIKDIHSLGEQEQSIQMSNHVSSTTVCSFGSITKI